MKMGQVRGGRQEALLMLGIAGVMLSGCRSGADIDIPLTLLPPTPTVEVVLTPTPVPPPPETLIVCLNQEPESLFLYSDAAMYGPAAAEAQTVLQAITDGPVDILD